MRGADDQRRILTISLLVALYDMSVRKTHRASQQTTSKISSLLQVIRRLTHRTQYSRLCSIRSICSHNEYYLLHIRLDDHVQPVIWRKILVLGNVRTGAVEWWIKGASDSVRVHCNLGAFSVAKMRQVTVSGVKRFEAFERKMFKLSNKAHGRDFVAKLHEIML